MTTTTHPSRLPEQEPTSPTAVVLCDDKSWVNTGAGWETRTQWLGAWGDLRDFAAEKGGATLYDLADLTTGLTEVQKEAVRGAADCFNCAKCHALRDAFPKVFADDLEAAEWKPGDPDGKLTDLLRVAEMDGAHTRSLGEARISDLAAKPKPGPWLRGDELKAILPTLKAGDVVEVGCMGHTVTGELWEQANCLSQLACSVRFAADMPGVYVDYLRIIERAPEPEPGADIPDEVAAAAGEKIMELTDKFIRVEVLRAALAAADAKRAELTGGEQACDRDAARERGWRAYKEGGGPDEVVDAVLAALPDPMGGAS